MVDAETVYDPEIQEQRRMLLAQALSHLHLTLTRIRKEWLWVLVQVTEPRCQLELIGPFPSDEAARQYHADEFVEDDRPWWTMRLHRPI